MPFTIPPDTRAVGTGDPPGDMNKVADTLTVLAGINVKNSAYAGGAKGDGVTNDTAAVQAAITALAATSGNAALMFPDGVYQVDSNALVVRNCANFTIRGAGAAVITQAPNTVSKPNNTTGNLFTIADCTDFLVQNLTFDGLRDTVAPLTPLSASASTGQPSVTVAAGQGARYQVGQKLYLFGGLGSSEQAQAEGLGVGFGTPLTIQSITAGGGSGGGDLITFTVNLGHSYTQISSTAVSDGYGPYAYAGAYLTPYQCGQNNTVAGRTLSGEDQQNGLHLLACQRFNITRVIARNTWESPIKLGTGYCTTFATDGCSQGTVEGCVTYHAYDQGISVWVSDHITVAGNVANATGWAGVSLSAGANYNTVIGNQVLNTVYRVPSDLLSGHGIAIEAGLSNRVEDNVISGVYGHGIYPRISPPVYPLNAANAPTLSAFLQEGTAAGTSIQVSATANLTAGQFCSILDGHRTEAVTVSQVVDGTHVKFAEIIAYSHPSGTFLIQRVSQDNLIAGNTITGNVTGHGIECLQSVRNVIKNNVITNWAASSHHGVTFDATASVGFPTGTRLGGDGTHLEGNTLAGGGGVPIYANRSNSLVIRGNRVHSPQTGSAYAGIVIFNMSLAIVADNYVSDIEDGQGIFLSASGGTLARCVIVGNIIERCGLQGILVQSGDSLTITGNLVRSNGGNAGIDLQGATKCPVVGNVANANQNAGIRLGPDGGNQSLTNRIESNTCRDDGTGQSVVTGAAWTQQNGILEVASSNNNLITGNECDGNAAGQITTVGAGTLAWANIITGSPAGNFPPALLPTWPGTEPPAAILGILGWNFPSAYATSSTPALTSGNVMVMRIPLTGTSISITNIVTGVTTAGSTLTASQCFAGVYDNTGAKIGGTADQSTVWNSTGTKTMALTGGPFNTSAPFVYVVILSNGTTNPQFARAAGAGTGPSLINLNTTAANSLCAQNGSAATALPASLTYSANVPSGGQMIWVGLS